MPHLMEFTNWPKSEGKPKMKLSENVEKVTLPGKKQVYRYFDENGIFFRDVVVLDDENPDEIETVFHPGSS